VNAVCPRFIRTAMTAEGASRADHVPHAPGTVRRT
jgi:hypothetical protein